MKAEQVIIIGAGPSGLAAAIQLKRYGMQPAVFERGETGGLLLNANLVENYPGFPSGIAGPELAKLFIQQAHNLDIQVTYEEVLALDYDQGLFLATTEGKSYAARVVVIATGTKPLPFTDIVIPEGVMGRVFYEVYPLLHLEEKCVVIVGSGDAAFDYGLNLSKKNRVVILNRGDTAKCLPLLWERAQKVANISYQPRTSVMQLEAYPEDRIQLDCQAPGGGLQLQADYLVGAIGREPQISCLSETLQQKIRELEERGYLYLIGDVKNGLFRQTSIAVGDGVRAAMEICRWFKEM